jgi:hypothetical protein
LFENSKLLFTGSQRSSFPPGSQSSSLVAKFSMRLHTVLIGCLVLSTFPSPRPIAAQEAAPPRFILHTKDGPFAPAPIADLTTTWTIELTGKKPLDAADWISLQQEGRARPAALADNVALLGNGERLPINPKQPIRLRDGRFLFTPAEPVRPAAGAELSLFQPHVALFLVAVPEGVDDPAVLVARLQHEARERDVVLLRNGDRIEGTVTALNETDGCVTSADGQTVRTAWPKLAGVAFATTSLARPQPKKLYAQAVLAGGARVAFTRLRFDAAARQWTGRTTSGADLAIAERGLAALDLFQGRAVYLSELQPLAYKHTPYLGIGWPAGTDAAADGGALRVGEEHFDKGIGLHGRCGLSYRLDGKYTWFEALVGLDPAAGPRARAKLAVWVDGVRHALAEDKEQTAADAPLPVRLDVRGAKTLMLVVNFGSLGDVQARVNWGGARLLKSKLN